MNLPSTLESRTCFYCGAVGATVRWPAGLRRALVWTCADSVACTARTRALLAERVNARAVA